MIYGLGKEWAFPSTWHVNFVFMHFRPVSQTPRAPSRQYKGISEVHLDQQKAAKQQMRFFLNSAPVFTI